MVKTSKRFFWLQWDLWIVTITLEQWIRWQTKAMMMSVDLTEGNQIPLKSCPQKNHFCTTKFLEANQIPKQKKKEDTAFRKGWHTAYLGKRNSRKTQNMDERKKYQCSDFNTDNIPVTSKVLLKKKPFRSSQEGCSDTRSSAVPPGEHKQGHCQAEKAEITGLQRANSCLCACSEPINLTDILI